MIREIKPEDTANYLSLMKALDHESSFMLYEPDERRQSLNEIEDHLKAIVMDPTKKLFVAEEEDQFIGFVEVDGNHLKRIKHRAEIVIGIREAHQGKGLGKALLSQAIEWSKENGVKRLELTVISKNKKALWLYSRMGFNVEGTRRKSIFVGNEWQDEFYMSLLLV